MYISSPGFLGDDCRSLREPGFRQLVSGCRPEGLSPSWPTTARASGLKMPARLLCRRGVTEKS